MSLLKFQFSIYDLTYCSYNHNPVSGCLENIQPLNEIVQTINVTNLLDPSKKFVITYIYYKQNDKISGSGYITPENPFDIKGVWALSETAATVLSQFLFDGMSSKSVLLNITENFYVFDNSTGKIIFIELIVENSIVTINGDYVN